MEKLQVVGQTFTAALNGQANVQQSLQVLTAFHVADTPIHVGIVLSHLERRRDFRHSPIKSGSLARDTMFVSKLEMLFHQNWHPFSVMPLSSI